VMAIWLTCVPLVWKI